MLESNSVHILKDPRASNIFVTNLTYSGVKDLRRDGSDNASNFSFLINLKALHAPRVPFLFLYISFLFSANVRREMIISQVLQRT